MKLTINIRFHQSHNTQNNLNQNIFADFFLKIGNGEYPIISDTENMIKLHSSMILSEGNLSNLIDFIYPNLIKNSENANYFIGRAILTLKNINVDKISDTIMERFPSKTHLYPNANSVDLAENISIEQSRLYSSEFLRSLIIPELPSDELKLKVGILIILLRNLNLSERLCNKTRLICHKF